MSREKEGGKKTDKTAPTKSAKEKKNFKALKKSEKNKSE
jgi:hypothetical protein